METLDKIQDLELMEFTSNDIEVVNEKLSKQNNSKNVYKSKFNFWDYILFFLNIKTQPTIFLDETTINSTWEKVIMNHYKHEQSEKPTSTKKSTENGIQSYLRKVGV